MSKLRDLINKKAGTTLAYDLKKENPSEVAEGDWVPTGSDWLDRIICKGHIGGIPLGRISELAGLEASGKSFFAAAIAAQAQKMGLDVVYFDSESSLDPAFLEKAGCDLGRLLYVQAISVEYVFETIEEILKSSDNKMLIIWDSIAFTPCVADSEGDYNPQSTMAMKARVLSKGLQKLVIPIANKNCGLLCLNQLKTNITKNAWEALIDPYFTPGGKSLAFAYSLRIWLTRRKNKDAFVMNEQGFRIGNEVKALVKKSRFGTEGRECAFKILWGGDSDVGVKNDESLLEILTKSGMKKWGGKCTLTCLDGSEEKFKESELAEKLKDENFKAKVFAIIDDQLVTQFAHGTGKAADYYNIDGADEIEKAIEEVTE